MVALLGPLLLLALALGVAVSARPARADTAIAALEWSSVPIAPSGSLHYGHPVNLTLTAKDGGGNPIAGTTVYLSFTATSAQYDDAYANVVSDPYNPLGATPAAYTTDGNGQIAVQYVASSFIPNGGFDELTAANDSLSLGVIPTVVSSTSYTYPKIAHLVWSSVPIAPDGTLGAANSLGLTLTAEDSGGNPIQGVTIGLTYSGFDNQSYVDVHDPQRHLPNPTSECGMLGSAPKSCATDDNGQIALINYVTSHPIPTGGGTDTITATDGVSVTSTTTYTYEPLASLDWSPVPIASGGSLAAAGQANVRLTATDDLGQPMKGVALWFSVSGTGGGNASVPHCFGGTASLTIGGIPKFCATDASGGTNVTYTAADPLPDGGQDFLAAGDTALSPNISADTYYTYAKATTLTYDGATSGEFHDSATLAATLVETNGSVPVSGATIHFALDAAEACDATTDTSGHASCAVTPAESAGPYTVTAEFAGSGADLPSNDATTFTVGPDDTALAFVGGPAFVANGQPLSLQVKLNDPSDASEGEASATAISGRTIVFTLGSGPTAQTCSGSTDGSGIASCTIALVDQGLGTGSVAASFAGDGYEQAASAAGSTIVFAYLGRGSFIIGDRSAIVNATVTWWSPMWSTTNQLSGGTAPSSFKGFAGTLSSTPPVAGGTWSTSGGTSASPPTSVPTYMAVIVTSRVTKKGSAIYFTGTDAKIAIVQVFPGYSPITGSPGTGKLLGFLP
jgi:hypothetical protein